jgi:hypothetical protein
VRSSITACAALNAADLEAAHKAGQLAIIADVEGLDFLEGVYR